MPCSCCSRVYYLLPFYVMVVNSVKPLDEIRQGNMLALPQALTLAPWMTAWSTAQIGVQATGLKPYFLNSILMVVPAVAISTLLGALNGFVLTKWRFRGDNLVFGLMLLACFIPFQIALIPTARILGLLGIAGTTHGARAGPRRLRPGLHHAVFPQLLCGVPDRTGQGGADRRRELLPDIPAHPAAVLRPDHRRHGHLAVHQYLERFSVRRLIRRFRLAADDGRAQQSRRFIDAA